jgi:hypothetical protein
MTTERITQGGSYLRKPDGSTELKHRTQPAPDRVTASPAPVAAKPEEAPAHTSTRKTKGHRNA